MPYDGNGNYVRAHNWVADAANALDINATEMDQEDNGIAAALSNCVTRDGQGKMGVDFLPNADNTLNLGSGSFRWAALNGTPINQIIPTQQGIGGLLYPRTAIEIAAAIVPTSFLYPAGHVYRYGTNTTPGTTDMTTALNNSITAVGNGGIVIWPNDTYFTTGPILAEGLRGLTIQCAGGQFGFNGTRIIGSHTGKTILSLVGSLYCTIGPVILEGNASTKPKTGLLLGRSSASSAGNHSFYGIVVQGSYTVAGVYNIASEENNWYGCYLVPTGAPFAGLYMSGAEGLSGAGLPLGGLTGSSMEDNKFHGCTIGNADATSTSTGLYIDCSAATGHIHFYSTFFVKQNGGDSFIFMRLGAIDGADTTFPIGFHNCSGESAGTAPTSGLHINNPTVSQRILAGFTAKNLRLQTPATNNILCDGTSAVQLVGAEISTPFRTGGKPSTFARLDGSFLSILDAGITINQMFGSILIANATPTITTSTGNVLMNMSGSYSASMSGPLGVNGVTPPARVTGFGTPTAGGVIANFPGSGASTAQCGQVLSQIIADLKAIGFYGS